MKGKTEKLGSGSFVGYRKGTGGYYFYNLQDMNVFVSTNTTFLKDKYINEYQLKSKVVLKEMSGNNFTLCIPSSTWERYPMVSGLMSVICQ